MATTDISRSSFNPKKHYRSVRMQQGRVLMDDDWNENERIHNADDHNIHTDIIGPFGSPDNGFLISKEISINSDAQEPFIDFGINRGTIYIGGIRLEMEQMETYHSQHDWSQWWQKLTDDTPVPDRDTFLSEFPEGERFDLVYLDAWFQVVSAVEDEELFETALGGPDTTTRLRIMRRVRIQPDVKTDKCSVAWDLFKAGQISDGYGEIQDVNNELKPDISLKVTFQKSAASENLCSDAVTSGYLGAENQTIRIQIVEGKKFTWGFDNASPLYRVSIKKDNGQPTIIHLDTEPKDKFHCPKSGQVVEIIPWTSELFNGVKLSDIQGHLSKVQTGYDPDTREFRISEPVREAWLSEQLFYMRIWNRGNDLSSDAAIQIAPDTKVPLNNTGLYVTFSGSHFAPGSFWIFSVRPDSSDTVIPEEFLTGRGPNGYKRFFAPLAIIRWHQENADSPITGERVRDCRKKFRPLTEIRSGCCLRVMPGDSLQNAVDTIITQGGGCISLCKGQHIVEGPLVISQGRNISISGENESTEIWLQDNNDGNGGILLSGCSNISFENMKIFSDSVSSLIHFHNDDPEMINEFIKFKRLHLINLCKDGMVFNISQSDNIKIDECRLVGDKGIVSLFASDIERVSSFEWSELLDLTCKYFDFRDLTVDSAYNVGDNFMTEPLIGTGSITFTGESFTGEDGSVINDGIVSVIAGAQGANNLKLSGINLDMNFERDLVGLLLTVKESQLSHFISINSESQVLMIEEMDDVTIQGVHIKVNRSNENKDEFLILLEGNISQLKIGSKDFTICNITSVVKLQIPLLPEYGRGVKNLQLINSDISFRSYGIWALKADTWSVDNCNLIASEISIVIPRSKKSGIRESRKKIEAAVFEVNEIDPDLRPDDNLPVFSHFRAVKCFFWQNSNISNSRLTGRQGINLFWCIGGTITGNTISSSGYSAKADWIHGTTIRNNVFTSKSSAALSFSGSYRLKINHNQFRGNQGIMRISSASFKTEIMTYLKEAATFHGMDQYDNSLISILFPLLWESLKWSGLDDIFCSLQEVASSVLDMKVHLAEIITTVLYNYLLDANEQTNIPLPVVALTISNNDIRTEYSCVDIREFSPVGGMMITDNTLHSASGQAVCINSLFLFANTNLIIALSRLVIKSLLDAFPSENAGSTVTISSNIFEIWYKQLLEEVNELSVLLNEKITLWSLQAEGFFENSYRLATNNIRSVLTAIESNIYNLQVENNFIELREHEIDNTEADDLQFDIPDYGLTVSYAFAVRDGNKELIRSYHKNISKSKNLENAVFRKQLSKKYLEASNKVANPKLKTSLVNVSKALSENNIAELDDSLTQVEAALDYLVNTFGVWLKGPGCRIINNQILVPKDVDASTSARGGILLRSGASDTATKTDDLLELMLIFLGDLFDPLIGITETLISQNKIIGGFGYGLDVHGIVYALISEELVISYFPDIKIHGNHIREMGGGGIVFDPLTLFRNVTISENILNSCGNSFNMAAATFYLNGINVKNVTNIRIVNNKITNCGQNLSSNLISLGGIITDAVYGNAEVSFNEIADNYGPGVIMRGEAQQTIIKLKSNAVPGRIAVTPGFVINKGFNFDKPLPILKFIGNTVNMPEGVENTEISILIDIIKEVVFSNNICHEGQKYRIRINSIDKLIVLGNISNYTFDISNVIDMRVGYNIP